MRARWWTVACLAAAGCLHGDTENEVLAVSAIAPADGLSPPTPRPVVAAGSSLPISFDVLERLGDGALASGDLVPTSVQTTDPGVLDVIETHLPDGPALDRHLVVLGRPPARA